MMSYTRAPCAHVWYEAIKIVLIREVGGITVHQVAK